ncbi:MAG: DMT family transporter [Lentihominibacter sp.]|nr:DMT family transporter [Clostridiales bacterium]MDY2679946.1 DMT family transporter [Lentihominibacter sp.]
MSKKMRGNLMLMLTAFIWGSSFVAQKSGMDLIGPLAFNGIRTLIGGIVLIPAIMFLKNWKVKKALQAGETAAEVSEEDRKKENRLLIIGGICCGIALLVASNLQQIGIFYTTAGKAGFITALYVVLVPICGLFIGKKVRPVIWLCVLASAVGLYLLCMPAEGGFGHINKGDLLIMLCALCFTGHILVIDYFSPKVDGVKLSCIQFFVAGILSIILMFPLDPALGFDLPSFSTLIDSWLPVLYAGVLSCGVAYTLQIVAQADTDPTVASMILCLESVFAVIAGMIILGESMSLREIAGCLIMFAAIVVSQLPAKEERVRS